MSFRQLIVLLSRVKSKIEIQGIRNTLSLILHQLSIAIQKKEALFTGEASKSIELKKLQPIYPIILEGLKYQAETLSCVDSALSTQQKPTNFIWLVPYFSKGSGGHKNLFRFINFLELFGCKCTIYIVAEHDLFTSPQEIKNQINEYFEIINADVKIYNVSEKYEKTDVVVSTSWITAYAALKIDADLKVYFVQDYEPLFYASGSLFHLAKNTYDFGYYHITLGKWLTHLLRTKHSAQADYYNIVLEKDKYYPRKNITSRKVKLLPDNQSFNVCFYARNMTQRRCFELVVMGLYLFSEKAENINIISYGWDRIPSLPFKCNHLGMLSVDELAELYSVCDVCIAPSSTNLSLVAHEVMACGCVLMDLDVDSTTFDLAHLSNSYLVKPNPNSICEGLLDLYNDRKLLKQIKDSSLQYISELEDWNYQGQVFYNLIKNKFTEIISNVSC
jgi:O-antigen biosynthesis protein